MAKIAILGGGISGLSMAYYLNKAPASVVKKILLIEGSTRLGGWIQTSRFEDGTVFEHGPRSMRGGGQAGVNVLQMVEDLGLTEQVLPIPRDHPAARRRFLYVKGQLCALPSGPGGIFRKLPPFSKPLVAFGWREPFRKSHKMEDEAVYEFFKRRLGDEVAMYGADPLCRGIFAGDSKQLSMKSCFPQVFDWEQKHGSIVRGAIKARKNKNAVPPSKLVENYQKNKWAMWSLKRGLQQLPETLTEYLTSASGTDIHTGTPCTEVKFTGNKVKVAWGDNEEEVDHVVSTVFSKNLAELVQTDHQTLADSLRKITAVSVGVVNLEFDGNVLPTRGFGHLVPSSETSKVLGVLYESEIFPDHNRPDKPSTRITCMMGGAWFHELFGIEEQCDPDHLGNVALEAVKEHLKVESQPVRVISKLQKTCIPQYVVGHSNVLQDLNDYVTERKLPLSLVGASYNGVSVNECIYNARLGAEELVTKLTGHS